MPQRSGRCTHFIVGRDHARGGVIFMVHMEAQKMDWSILNQKEIGIQFTLKFETSFLLYQMCFYGY